MKRLPLIVAALCAVGLAALLVVALSGPDDEQATKGDGKASSGKASSRLDTDDLRLREVGKFRNPVAVGQPLKSPELLFVVEKRGVIRVVRNGKLLERPFLDLSARVTAQGTEQGMLSVAFPRNYRQSRRLYVSYTDRRGDLQVDEFRRSRKAETVARRVTRRPVIKVRQPDDIHQSGTLVFGPDRRLYIGSGDGGPSYDPDDRGQDKHSLLGKLLRIEPRRAGKGKPYSIPAGNPFRGRGRAEIYAYGLRNPWRFSFDRETGALLIGDVGQDLVEEIDFVRPRRARGANFGWSGFEGTRPFKRSQQSPKALEPLHEYLHEGRCSVTGGYVVRGEGPEPLLGRYLFGDFCDGELRTLVPPTDGRSKDVRKLGLTVPALVSFGEGSSGEIYAVSLEGPVYELVAKR